MTLMGRGMYALPSRPNKVVANARIGPSKTLNNLETRESNKQQSTATGEIMSSPKPVFHNGNRSRMNNMSRANSVPQQQTYSNQHEDIVKYLSDSWNRVNHELDRNQREGGPVVYRERNPNPRLNDFKAFDLDQFWGDRYLQQVTGSSS